CPFAHVPDELARDLEVDVRLEQREPDLAHRARDRLLVEHAAAAEVAEGLLELLRESVEHESAGYRDGERRPRRGAVRVLVEVWRLLLRRVAQTAAAGGGLRRGAVAAERVGDEVGALRAGPLE